MSPHAHRIHHKLSGGKHRWSGDKSTCIRLNDASAATSTEVVPERGLAATSYRPDDGAEELERRRDCLSRQHFRDHPLHGRNDGHGQRPHLLSEHPCVVASRRERVSDASLQRLLADDSEPLHPSGGAREPAFERVNGCGELLRLRDCSRVPERVRRLKHEVRQHAKRADSVTLKIENLALRVLLRDESVSGAPLN